jgi:Kef-type K+ transport system membrane component KefB/nucleotide-binding universal stress UspA family protein
MEVTSHPASAAIFLSQIVAFLVCGRLLGELMQRIGQASVLGQLAAGMLLGPSVLGAISPELEHSLFPSGEAQRAMINSVGELGIVLLLLLAGMETDLGLVRRSGRAALSVSLAGIAIPFACGVGVGTWLPDSMLPDPGKRLVTALFLGTALSISSVKIVALLVRELGFLRRTVGQVIVASAIIDDTLGWIIMSVTFGLALRGAIDIPSVLRAVLGTLAFLGLSLTVGRRVVYQLIRWVNDNFVSELPVITVIIAITGVMALITQAIGVHTVLGAFVAGIVIGDSPILTRHIEAQLRGLIIALFMPVFFGLAGLSTDLQALGRPDLLLLTLGLIAIASIGKFSGAMIGGRAAGLSYAQSLAVGCGMNARGSTEIIIASIGLSAGVLNQSLFTSIVTMAIVTTMAMPPMLRWALGRLPMTSEEQARLEREELEARSLIPNIERLLLAVDSSPSGELAGRLAGHLAGVRGMPTTVVQIDSAASDVQNLREQQVARTATAVKGAADSDGQAATPEGTPDIQVRVPATRSAETTISTEAKKGYGLLFIGREPAAEGDRFHDQITRAAAEFGGPFAIVIARGKQSHIDNAPLKVLVPVSGTPVSRHGGELAIALTETTGGTVTALHVPRADVKRWLLRNRYALSLARSSIANSIIREIVRLGEIHGVAVTGAVRAGRAPDEAVLRELQRGQYNLVVMGVTSRPTEQLFFGEIASILLTRANCSVVFLASEGDSTAR